MKKLSYLVSASSCYRLFIYAFLVLVGLVLIPAQVSSQSNYKNKKVRIGFRQGTVKKVLNEIKDQTDCIFTYSSSKVDLNEVVFLDRKRKTLEALLNEVFSQQPIIPYFKAGKRIILAYDIDKNTYLEQTTILNGFIKDKDSGEPLIGASIYNEKKQIGTLSNDFGYFQFLVDNNVDTITFSYLGYSPRSYAIKKLKKDLFSIYLKPKSLKLDDIIIESKVYEKSTTDLTSNNYINESVLRNSRGQLGEQDPFQSLFALSGIQSGHEGQNNIYVRGGAADQNLIMMDGVPLYETSHLLGLTSIFNADAVKNVQVFKQAFPSSYGGRLSSVVNFHMNEGNLNEHHFGVGISPLSARLNAEGPLSEGRTSYNLSLRKSLVDFIVDPIAKKYLDNNKTDISFHDINAKVSHQLSDGSNLDLNLYYGKDKIAIDKSEEITGNNDVYTKSNQDQMAWSNKIFSVRWNRIINDNLFTRVQFHFSDYAYDTRSTYAFNYEPGTENRDSELDVLALSRLEDAAIKLELNYFFNNNTKLVFGGGSTFHKYNPSIRQSTIKLAGDLSEFRNGIPSIDASEWFGFAESQIKFSPSLHLNTGVHFTRYLVRDKVYSSLQPRLSLSYSPSAKHQWSFSATKMSQFVHLLINTGIGLPSELWIPTTDMLPPEHAYQVSTSYSYRPRKKVAFTVDAYYKIVHNVVEYTSPFDLFNTYLNDDGIETKFEANSDWEKYVSSGNGRSKGIELSIDNTERRFQYGLSYSWSKTDRTFEGLNYGNAFPFKYDRTHDLNLSMKYQFSKALSFDAKWIYGTGNAFSLAIEQYRIDNKLFLNPSGRNNLRMPEYHRLDLGLRWLHTINKGSALDMSLGVYNAYNRMNAYYVYLVSVDDSFKLKQVSVFPILPNFNIYYTF